MANKDLFKQAIAEAKSVREAAIANAKEALEESLTPHLKDMLAAKLQEMEDKSVEEEVVNEIEEELEEANHDKKDDEKMEEAKDDKKDEAIEEDLTEVPAVAEEDEAEDDSDESEDDAEVEEPEQDHDEVDGDEDLSKLSVDQFKDLIRDIINQEMGADAAPDMDGGDIEGMGDEPAIEEPAGDDLGGDDEEEINLDELLQELEAISEEEVEEGKKEDKMEEGNKEKVDEAEELEEDTNNQMEAESDTKDHNVNNVQSGALKEELDQALETIETLKSELNEVNILNSKLLYVNKIFKANSLSESQKVNIIAAFDKAETVKEVKLVYETVSDNFSSKKEVKNETIKEAKNLSMASKAGGTSAAKPEVIAEVSDTVRRMQKLAGIIK
jgi:hypothetical protein